MPGIPHLTQQKLLDDTPRGCGQLKRGGCYLVGTAGATGGLRVYYPLLARPWETEAGRVNMLYTEVPPRTPQVFDPRATLIYGELRYPNGHTDYDFALFANVDAWPNEGIIDHVGAQHYPTPRHFIDELRSRGPSRRVTPRMAAACAKLVPPFPIFFTHAGAPLFKNKAQAEGWIKAARAHMPDAQNIQWDDWTPTWHADDFLPYAGTSAYRAPHPVEAMLHYDRYSHTQAMQDILPISDHAEAIICGSWVTDVVYIGRGPDDTVPPELAAAGVQLADIEEN